MPVRHLQLGLTFDQYDQIAAVGLAREHHRPEYRTFHKSVIARQIEPAGRVALAARLVAGNAPPLEDRRNIIGVADLRLLGASLAKRRRERRTGYREHTGSDTG